MRPLSAAAAVLALAAVPVGTLGAAEAMLTPRNSVDAALVVRDSVRIEGVGCGVPASATVALPAGAVDVRLRKPSVGARGLDAALTGVSVQGSAVVLTAIADGAAVCDPLEEDTPPASRPWSAQFDVEVAFRQRVGVRFWEVDGPRGGTFTARPREVRMGISGAARGVRWTRFGGAKAVGLGRFRSLIPCAGGCADDRTRIRVELTRPGRCPGLRRRGGQEDVVFYARVAFVLGERLGVLRPGREWFSARRTCPPGDTPPIPVR